MIVPKGKRPLNKVGNKGMKDTTIERDDSRRRREDCARPEEGRRHRKIPHLILGVSPSEKLIQYFEVYTWGQD